MTSENAQLRRSGLQCLQLLFSRVRRDVNFPSLVSAAVLEEYGREPEKVLMRLAADQHLAPEQFQGMEVFAGYAGPALMKLKNDEWVLVLSSQSLRDPGGAVPIADPAAGPQVLNVPAPQLLERGSGSGIIFRNPARVEAGRQTRLTSLVLIARHHNIQADIQEIMHEYAVGGEEVGDNLFREIAASYQFKQKKVRLSWAELQKSGTIFPCIAVKKSGKYAVLCGFRRNPENGVEAVVVDPESPRYNSPDRFLFFTEDALKEEFGGTFILLKKIYRLSDEQQPFGLRWFVPEFIKNKGLFGKIALMVVMLTIC